jgi:phenylpropionate dioxygenase-like ring-hydroxylating dioxygenase large terminal subunit
MQLTETSAPSNRPGVIQQIVDGIDGSVGDIAQARTVPPAAYTSELFFEFERRAIFDRSWLFLCHASEIPRSGDFQTVTIIDEPLIITRDEQAKIHVLSAICQHRGSVLADGKGSERYLRCPYHSWTYGLDGRLLGAPSMAPGHSLAELKAGICLPRLRVEVWHGMVFANFDQNAQPLAPTLAKLEPVIAGHRFEDLVVAESVTLPNLPFNWKNMQENALEEYHTTYVHKGYHENAPAHLVERGAFEPGDGGIYRHAGLIIKGGEDVPGRPTFPVIDGLPEQDRGYFIFLAIPPQFFAAVYPHGLKVFRIVPQAANEMTLTISFHFPRATIDLPAFPSMLKRQLEFIDLIDREDIDSNTRMFRGLRSRFAPRGPYSPQEATLPQFNEWLLERYRSELAAGLEDRPAPGDGQGGVSR